jgi:hypothetical protein
MIIIVITSSNHDVFGDEKKEKIYRERNDFFLLMRQKVGTHPLNYKGLKFKEVAQRFADQHGMPDSFDCELGYMCILKYYIRHEKSNYDVYIYFTQSKRRYANEYGMPYYSETYTVRITDPVSHKEILKEKMDF